MKNFIVQVGAKDRKILASSAYNAVVVAYPHLVWDFQERSGEAYKFHTVCRGKRYPACVSPEVGGLTGDCSDLKGDCSNLRG